MDRTNFEIPLICGDKRYNIKIGVDGDMFYAFGSNFINLQDSVCGFGKTLDLAVIDLIECTKTGTNCYKTVPNPDRPGQSMNVIITPQNYNL
jgi:hypothetical protein